MDEHTKVLVNAKEASKMLSVSERMLWTLTNQGEVPAIRIGRSVRYDPADIWAYVDRKRTGGV